MSYIKPSVLVYQELENAGGATNSTPDLGVVIVGPLFNVVRVDTASESSLTSTLGKVSSDLPGDSIGTVDEGAPYALKINLTNTKPGQVVDQSSVITYATNAYVKTVAFSADVGTTVVAAGGFDGTTFRSKFTLWDSVGEVYLPTFSPSGVTPEKALPDNSGSHARLGDKILVKYTSPDLVGGTTTFNQVGTVVTVTGDANHGLTIGNTVYLNFATGPADGEYEVVGADLLTFTVAAATGTASGSVTVAKVTTVSTVITGIEAGTSSSGAAVTKSITIAQPIEEFVSASAVTASITVQRFYDQMIVPETYVSGINTIQQFDLDTADSDYIYLYTDTGPAAYSTVTYGTPDEYEIASGGFHVAYKALRQDTYSSILTIASAAERESLLGEATEENPLGLGVKLALDNTTTSVMAVSLKKDGTSYEWTRALELIENQRLAYAITPLTQDESVIAAFKVHALDMSTPENASWRVVIANTKIPAVKYILQANGDAPVTTGTSKLMGSTLFLKDLVHANVDSVTSGEFVSSSVTPGDILVVTAVTGATVVPQAVTIATGLTIGSWYHNTATAAITVGATSVPADGYAVALTSTTSALSENPDNLIGSWTIDEVTNSNYLKVLEFEDKTTLDGLGITYYIYRDLSRAERAASVAGASVTFGSNRVWHIQPDIVGVNVGGIVKYLPGYYLAAAHAGMTAGFPVQQGFTNIAVAGIEDLQNSNFYFKKEELNLMAEAGTCIYVQETQGSLPYCRHSLTTDMSVLEYREQVKVKNWDFLSFYVHDRMKPFIGVWNITPDTLSNMKQTLIASLEGLLTQKLPRIGAPLLSYLEPTVVQNAVNKDMVDIRVKIETVTPNNYTNIYLVI